MAPVSIRPTASTRAFGIALKRARRAAHLTQAELAERAGFSVVYISMLERGARQPQPSTVTLLADALELTAPDRAALEAAAQTTAPLRRSRDRAEVPHFPVGGFLGALPAGQLVGRERELAVVDEALAAVGEGQGRLLVLVGEPGVGKTRLAQEITLKARAQGFRIISGRCYEPQQSVAYYPFLEALAMATADAGPLLQAQLPERWPEVARLLPERLASVQSPLQPDDRNAQQRLFWQLSGFLGALAEQTPLAVLLDDLQWADSASVDLLLHLTRQTRDHPILLVGTARAVEAARQHPLADALSDLRRDELMKQLLLSPLAAAEASVLGQVVAFEELRRLGGRGEQEVEEALEEASGAGIIREGDHDRYHFNHALTCDTLYADLPARRKRRLHRAAAEAIEGVSDYERRAAELSYHLLAADERERALPYALLAGDQAEAVYAHVEAERHYRTALEIAHDLGNARSEAQALEKLGDAINALGRHVEAADACQRALRAYEELNDQLGELRALSGLLMAQSQIGREKVDEASALARAILARIEPLDAAAVTPVLGSALAAAYTSLGWILWISSHYDEAQVELRHAIDLARAVGDEAQLALAQFWLIISGGLERTVEAFEETLALAQRSGQTAIVVASHNMAGAMYEVAGDFEQALAHFEQSIVVAERQQDLRHLAWQLKNFSRFLFDNGDWRRMREVFARADTMMQELDRHYGETWMSSHMPIHRGMYALAEGREEVGRWLLEEVIERVAHTVPSSVLLDPTCQLAEADLLAGDAEQARQRIATFLHDPRPESPEWHENEPLLLLLTWAEAILGEEALAEARLEKLLADASPLFRVDVLRIQGMLAILRRRWEVGVAALQEAVERAHAMPFPYAEAKTLWVYGRLETARGEPQRAREKYEQALAICDRLGEGLYRTYIERDLRRLAHSA